MKLYIRGAIALVLLATTLPVRAADKHPPSDHRHCSSPVWIPEGFEVRPARRAPGPLVLGSAAHDDSLLVGAVDETRFGQIVAELAGASSFMLDGSEETIRTRWALDPDATDGISLAEDYLEDRFQAAGYTVQRQSFPFTDLNGPMTGSNIIAIKLGVTRPDEILVVGAHLDARAEQNWLDAPGAEDNATGTAAVLHLAELLAAWETQRTIHFIGFGVEEFSLRGSSWYAVQAVENGDQIVGALTMDMISAWVDDFGVLIEGKPEFEDLMFVMRDNVEEWTTIDYDLAYESFGSDHVPLQLAGIPAILSIDLDWGDYADYHTSTDLYPNIDTGLGIEIVRAMAGAISDIAGIATDFPVPPQLALLQNRPNPFNPLTTIEFAIPAQGNVRLAIHDARGRHIRTLVEAPLAPGEHSRDWDGTDDEGRAVASGVYLCRLDHPTGTRTSKLTLLR